MIKIVINEKYYRKQFDDWIAGGKVEYKGKTYCWKAENINYGFGWEIDPLNKNDWGNIQRKESKIILKTIQKCLLKHRTEYVS